MCRKIDWSVSGVMEPKDKRETFPCIWRYIS
jgi:hypothetical protein